MATGRESSSWLITFSSTNRKRNQKTGSGTRPLFESVFCCFDKHPDRKQPGEELFVWPACPNPSPPFREAMAETQARQELKPRRNAMYQLASHGSPCFFFHTSQVHVPRGGTAHNGLGSPQYSLIKKMFPRYAHRSICWNHFLNRDNFTQVCSVKQTENLTSKATSSQSLSR